MDRVDRLTEHRPRISVAVKNVMNDSGLCDVWRRLNPKHKQFTWVRKNPFGKLPYPYSPQGLLSVYLIQ